MGMMMGRDVLGCPVNRFGGVVALFVVVLVSAPCLLGAVAREESRGSKDLYDEVPMINLAEELSTHYSWSRPRERRLDVTTFVWCTARNNTPDTSLQSSLDWVCGTNPNQGQVNCGPVNVGGACYEPNTLQHHCDWAFNAYFQRMNATSAACDFQGAAQQVTTDPSSGTCVFLGSNLTVITGNNGTISPTSSPGAAPGPSGFIYGSGSAPLGGLVPQFLFRISTPVILFTYLFKFT